MLSAGSDLFTPDELATAPPTALLSELARVVPGSALDGDSVVTGITYDSRRVLDGALFFALPGVHTDGHDHAGAAAAAGASGIVVERRLDLGVAQLVVPSVRRAIGPMSAVFYGQPSARLSMIAVTGTNGKTTTCTVIRHCLSASGVPAGQIGTVGSHFLGRSIGTSLTTPQAPDLQWLLRQMVRARVRAVAMEASSHGLEQGRLDGIRFDIGIFTNLSREHLDYHGTMERYFEAKAALFDESRCGTGIVCVDSDWGRTLARTASIPVTTFGERDDADVTMVVEERGLDGIAVAIREPDGEVTLTSPLVGRVNGTNVAAAYLSARQLGVEPAAAAAAIAAAPPPPGRFEIVDAGQPFLVVVDYAHTPDALAALIGTARRLATGRVFIVLGARGGRDRGKRPMIGQVVARADRVFLTTDSPGEEPLADIIRALYRGTLDARSSTAVVVEPDRRGAIEMAVRDASDGDVVLVVGRGHEQFQHIGSETVQLDDRVAAREALLARAAGIT